MSKFKDLTQENTVVLENGLCMWVLVCLITDKNIHYFGNYEDARAFFLTLPKAV